MKSAELEGDIGSAAASHQRLLATVDGLIQAMTFTAAAEVRDSAHTELELLALGVA